MAEDNQTDDYPPIRRFQSDATTAFLRAARSGNLEKVIEYLDTDLDINTANSNGLNALHLASKDGHVEIVTELLKRGAKVDAATKKGNTALHIASLAGQSEIVNILIQYGAAVNIQSQNGFTPLYMAAQENHDQVVKILLNNGANQSLATEDGFTPLAVAMQQGHDKVVSVLLENDSKGKVRLPALHIAAKKDDCKAADLLLQNDHKPDVTSKSGFTPLHIAAHYGNEDIARLLIKRGADVNYLAKHNISPLHVAAKWGKNNMVKILLENGAIIDAKTRDGLTPLHCAARSGHEQCVTTLLESSAPISARTKNGLAPLHMASQGDHVDAARVLLYHRAPVDEVTIDYLTSLHVAAHCGHVRVAKLLLDRKADPNARALNGFTPLHIACKKNRIKVVELLLKHGASIESTTESGLTPLHVASFMGCMNIVIFLLQHEANPDVPTVRGETPLHLAARANQTDIIRILLRNGAKVDARAREQQTPLHIASRLGNVDIVMLLLQHGAAVDNTTKDMYTALHIAAKEGQEEVAAILVDNNASVKATTKNGFTPLHVAAKYGNVNVAKILLQKDSKLDAQGKNDVTPLLLACHYDHPNVAQLLLEKGASAHLTSQNGQTPLHVAARKNQMDIALTLLEHGAKANVESKAGFTPLHLSAQKGHYDMTNLLIEHGADPNHKAKNGLTALHLCAQEDFTRVASILVKNGANVESETETGYRPIHIAAHFGNLSMIHFLLKHSAKIDVKTKQNYTPLHQAAQQGHAHVVSALIEGNASHKARTNDGLTALNIAQKLGYISVMEVLKGLPYDGITPDNKNWEEKYKVIAPESLQETNLMSDSDDEGGSDALISEQPYRYLTADLMKSLRDDSLPIDVTRDDPVHRQLSKEEHQEFVQSNNYCSAENFDSNDFSRFLVSFLVDARGGTMKGCRHSGIRLIVPPRRATMPIRVTCRLVKPSKMPNPPPLMEGESLATRVVEMGPVGATFLGPVLIDIPHFASVQGKEREIIILRSENGETWKEHDNSADNDDTLLNTSYDAQMSASHSGRITRIITTEFPQYFAIVTRIKQEVHVIGAEGGILISSVASQVQAVFPPGALTKKIKVGLQAHVIPAELTAKLLGNCVAVSPVITIEPRRRKFHKPISLTIPVPQAANKGMINHYGGETPTLRLLCSIAGGTSEAQWEDVTGSTPLNFMNDRVSFTTTVSARFWLMDCRNIQEVPKMATDLYRESLFVPFITNFVIYSKRMEEVEATLRILCMTDSKEGIPTLEKQEEFAEIVKSRDVETLDGKDLYIEFTGNLVPVTKSGVQLKFTFKAFRQNRLSFHVKVKDPHLDPVARMMFMKEPKVAKGDPAQQPLCVLNIVLPEISYEQRFKDVQDSNILSQKMDVLKSKYKLDYYEEKGDQPKRTSPSDKKFITDTDVISSGPLESVDPSLVIQNSPALEKKTYSEKRRFWEDMARSKRESFQRSESEISHTSQQTYHDSDSECLSEVREKSEEEVGPPIDMSEGTVAEKAHYFEEQIQKEKTAARGSLKSQSSQESGKTPGARLSGISISSEDDRSLEVFEETERLVEEMRSKVEVKAWDERKDEKKDDTKEKKAELEKDEKKDEKRKSKESKDLLGKKQSSKEEKPEKRASKDLSDLKADLKDLKSAHDKKSKTEPPVKSKLETDLHAKEIVSKLDEKVDLPETKKSDKPDAKTKTSPKSEGESKAKATKMQENVTKQQKVAESRSPVTAVKTKSKEETSPKLATTKQKSKEESSPKSIPTRQRSKEEPLSKSPPKKDKPKDEPLSKSPPKRDRLKEDTKLSPKSEKLKETATSKSQIEKGKDISPEKAVMKKDQPKSPPKHDKLKDDLSRKSPPKNEKRKLGVISPQKEKPINEPTKSPPKETVSTVSKSEFKSDSKMDKVSTASKTSTMEQKITSTSELKIKTADTSLSSVTKSAVSSEKNDKDETQVKTPKPKDLPLPTLIKDLKKESEIKKDKPVTDISKTVSSSVDKSKQTAEKTQPPKSGSPKLKEETSVKPLIKEKHKNETSTTLERKKSTPEIPKSMIPVREKSKEEFTIKSPPKSDKSHEESPTPAPKREKSIPEIPKSMIPVREKSKEEFSVKSPPKDEKRKSLTGEPKLESIPKLPQTAAPAKEKTKEKFTVKSPPKDNRSTESPIPAPKREKSIPEIPKSMIPVREKSKEEFTIKSPPKEEKPKDTSVTEPHREQSIPEIPKSMIPVREKSKEEFTVKLASTDAKIVTSPPAPKREYSKEEFTFKPASTDAKTATSPPAPKREYSKEEFTFKPASTDAKTATSPPAPKREKSIPEIPKSMIPVREKSKEEFTVKPVAKDDKAVTSPPAPKKEKSTPEIPKSTIAGREISKEEFTYKPGPTDAKTATSPPAPKREKSIPEIPKSMIPVREKSKEEFTFKPASTDAKTVTSPPAPTREKSTPEIPKSMIPVREKSKEEFTFKPASTDAKTATSPPAPKREKSIPEIPKSMIPVREKSKEEFAFKPASTDAKAVTSPPAPKRENSYPEIPKSMIPVREKSKEEFSPLPAVKREKSTPEIPKSMIPVREKSKEEFSIQSSTSKEIGKESPFAAPKREKSIPEIPPSMIPKREKSKDEFSVKSPPLGVKRERSSSEIPKSMIPKREKSKEDFGIKSPPSRERSIGEIPKSMIPKREKSKEDFGIKSPPSRERSIGEIPKSMIPKREKSKEDFGIKSPPSRERSIGEIPKSMIPRREKSKEDFGIKSPPSRERSIGEIPKSMIPRREKSKEDFGIKSPPSRERSIGEIPKSMIPVREKSKEDFGIKSPPSRERSIGEIPKSMIPRREKSKEDFSIKSPPSRERSIGEIPKSMIPKREKSKDEFSLKSPPHDKLKDGVPSTSHAKREKSKDDITKPSTLKHEKSKEEFSPKGLPKREKSKDEIHKTVLTKREKSKEDFSPKLAPKREKSKDDIPKTGIKRTDSKTEQSPKGAIKKTDTKTLSKRENSKEDIPPKSDIRRRDSKEESPRPLAKKVPDTSKGAVKREKSRDDIPKTPLSKRRDSKEESPKSVVRRLSSSSSKSDSSSSKASDKLPKKDIHGPKKGIETVTVTKREKSEEVMTQEYEERARKETSESQVFSGTFTGDPKEALKLLENVSALKKADFVTSSSVVTSKVDHKTSSSLEKKEVKSSEIDTGKEKIIAHEENENVLKKETSASIARRSSPEETVENRECKIKEISLGSAVKSLANITDELQTIQASALQMGKGSDQSIKSTSVKDDEKTVTTVETSVSKKDSNVGVNVKLEKDLKDETAKKDDLGKIIEKSMYQEEIADSSKTVDIKEDFKSKADGSGAATTSMKKGFSPDSGTIESEVYHDELADDLTRKFENIMRKSVDTEKDIGKSSIQEELIDVGSTRDSISLSGDITLSSSQAKLHDKDITLSPSSISDQVEIGELHSDINKQKISSLGDVKVDAKGTIEGKFVSELSGARVLEILEPENESQSRQDSMDVSSIEIDEVKFSSGAQDLLRKEVLHESPAIDSLETLERDVTMSPITCSEDTNIDYSLPQDSHKKDTDIQKLTIKRSEKDSFEIESPPLVSPRLKIKELEIKPVDWMIGDEKIEVSEPLEPFQAFNKELEEYQMKQRQGIDILPESNKKFDIPRIEETGSMLFDDPELTKLSGKSKFTVIPVSEQDIDLDKELVENKLDISCQELIDTLQREHDAKTPTSERMEEMASKSFQFIPTDDDEDSFDFDKQRFESERQADLVDLKHVDLPLETKTAVNVIEGEQFTSLVQPLQPTVITSKSNDNELIQLYEEQFEETVEIKGRESELKKDTKVPDVYSTTTSNIESMNIFEEQFSGIQPAFDKSSGIQEKQSTAQKTNDGDENKQKGSYNLKHYDQQPEKSEMLLKMEAKDTPVDSKKEEVQLLSYKTLDPEESKTDVHVTAVQKTSKTDFHREGKGKGWEDHKRMAEKREKSHSHQETSPYKVKKEDFQNVDMSARYAITVLDQVVKKEIAEVKENLEAAKQDLIEELSENSENVIQIKDSPSEFQFKIQPESIPNELPFLYRAPSHERVSDTENLSSSSSPIAKPRRHGELTRDESSSESSSAEKKVSDKDISKTSIVIESESDKSSKLESKDIFESFSSSPKAASRSGSDAEGTAKDDTFSLQPPQPAPRRRVKPSRGHQRHVTSESDADVSSSGESNYQSCEYESESRPCSSDVEALQSAAHASSTTASEYDTAMMSLEHTSSKATSQDYHTAANTLSSRESMKSLNSLSSGQMGSLDSTSELSETLMASEAELDKDAIDENLENVLDDDMKTSNCTSEDEAGKPFEMDSAVPCMMKRSSEMIFSQLITKESGEATDPSGKESDSSLLTIEEHPKTQSIPKQPSETLDEPSTSSSEVVDTKAESCSFEPDSLEVKYISTTSLEDENADGQAHGSGLTLQQQLSMTSSSMSGVSLETVIEKELADRNSDSDSFELVDKPDLIDDFVVVEEVGREAEEYDSEGKGIRISSMSCTSSKNYDRDVENLITEKKQDIPKPQAHSTRSTAELFEFESEESPPQASTEEQYSQSYSDEEQYNEGGRKWIEMQFQQNETRLYDMEYERGPLEDIKEEEVTDFEASSSRFGSVGSQKESIGSIGSMRGSFGSTPDNYDALTAKRYFKPTDHDNLSLSSLQEFEHLENAVALENAKRREQQHSGSQDSSSNGSLPKRYITSRSGPGDDISLSSVKDFEVLETACKEAHLIELRAREEEDLLDHESPENRYKLENLARAKVESQGSAPGSFNPSTSGSDDYEKRIKEIDEIIRLAQANVEKIEKHDDTTEDVSQIDLTDTADKPPAPVTIIAGSSTVAHEPERSRVTAEANLMETSTDSLEIEGNEGQNYNAMCRSSDSLELKTTLDYPSLSSDSLNNVKDPKEEQDRRFSTSRRISSDSLEFPVLESQDSSKDIHRKGSSSES